MQSYALYILLFRQHTGEKPSAESLCDRRSDFEQYDRLTFVVVLLNFLREDAAPLLRPAERSQIADHACQPATRQDGATGEHMIRLVGYYC